MGASRHTSDEEYLKRYLCVEQIHALRQVGVESQLFLVSPLKLESTQPKMHRGRTTTVHRSRDVVIVSHDPPSPRTSYTRVVCPSGLLALVETVPLELSYFNWSPQKVVPPYVCY